MGSAPVVICTHHCCFLNYSCNGQDPKCWSLCALSLDTLGLAVATVSSVQFALSNDAPLAAAAVLGLIGAVSGGLFRDIMCQTEPVLLHRETVGTACLSGALVYLALDSLDLSEAIPVAVAGVVVVLVRELSIKFNWNLPTIQKGN
jgi:uncharacterized membrane protein YeiH